MRYLIIFLSIALLGNAGAATFGSYTYVINPDNVSVTITDYPTDATGARVIPAIIDGRSVTELRILSMQWPDQHHHSQQRHQHRGLRIQ